MLVRRLNSIRVAVMIIVLNSTSLSNVGCHCSDRCRLLLLLLVCWGMHLCHGIKFHQV